MVTIEEKKEKGAYYVVVIEIDGYWIYIDLSLATIHCINVILIS